MVSRAVVRRDPMGVYRRRDALPARATRPHPLPEYLEKSEIESLLRIARSPQAALLFLIQWRAGLRISEAIALEPSDLSLDGDRPTLRVRKGKGNKPRVVPVHPELSAAFRTALAYGGRKVGPIVPITRKSGWRWIKEAVRRATEAGLLPQGRRIGTHTLRHSAARHWLASGIPINVVSRWLGHSSLQTTLVYLQILPDPLGDMERVP